MLYGLAFSDELIAGVNFVYDSQSFSSFLNASPYYYGDRKGLMMIGATPAELDVIERNLASRGVLATEFPTPLWAKAEVSGRGFTIIVHGPSTNTVETAIQKVFKVDWTNFDKILRQENPDGVNDAKAQKWCKLWLERQGAKWRDDGPGILVNPLGEEVVCFGLEDDLRMVGDILLRLGDPAKAVTSNATVRIAPNSRATNTSSETVEKTFRLDNFALLAAIEREPDLTYTDIDDDLPEDGAGTNSAPGGANYWAPPRRKSTRTAPQNELSTKNHLFFAFMERMGFNPRLRGRAIYYGDRKSQLMLRATPEELEVIERNLASRGVLATGAPVWPGRGPVNKVFKITWTNFQETLRRENPKGVTEVEAGKWCKAWLERQGAKWRDSGPNIGVNPLNEEIICSGQEDDVRMVEDTLFRFEGSNFFNGQAKADVPGLTTARLGAKSTVTNEPNTLVRKAYVLTVDFLARFGSNDVATPGATNDTPAIRAINALCQKAGFDASAPGRYIHYGENPPYIEVRATLEEQTWIEQELSALNPETNAAERKLYAKMFQVEAASLQSDIRRIQGYSAVTLTNDASATEASARLKEFFTSKGADFAAPGKAIFFNARASQLYVRAGLADLEIVENTIGNLNIADIQRREFHCDTGVLLGRIEEEMRAKGLAYSGKGGLSDQASESLKTLFARDGAGMDAPGAQVLFDISKGLIVVDARPADWPAIEGVLNRLGRAPQQIQLVAKYYLLDEPAYAGLSKLFDTLDLRAQVALTDFGGDVRPDQFASLRDRLTARDGADAAAVANKGMPVLAALNNEQNTRIADFLGKRDGVSRLAGQSVVTLTGRRAYLFVKCSKESNSVESLPPVGISLNVYPQTNDSAGIYLQLEITSMSKLGTIQDIPPSKRVENHISDEEALRDAASTNHAPVFKAERDSRAFIARDQKPILLAGLRYCSTLDACQRIVIIITPTMIDPAGNPTHRLEDL